MAQRLLHNANRAQAQAHKSSAHVHAIVRPYSCASTTSAVVLEVERKFNVTPLLRSHLNGTVLQQRQLRSLKDETHRHSIQFCRLADQIIRDQYFDHNDRLSSKGIWIRRRIEQVLPKSECPKRSARDRIAQWEAKVRLGGNLQNSEFEEVTTEEEVFALARRHVPDIEWLQQTVDLTTVRERWVAQEGEHQFQVVIDSCSALSRANRVAGQAPDFYHLVGEVELTENVSVGSDGVENVAIKRAAVEKMNNRLEEFMDRHVALFPITPTPTGKLTAYFAWLKALEDQHPEART